MSTNNITALSMLDVSKLIPNTTIKNYPTMCQLLNEPIKSGKAKMLQIESWKSYFDFTIIGHKYKIGEVYSLPKGKQTKRYGFINHIEELILDLLVQDKNGGKVTLSKSKLFRELNMINDNYNFGRYNIPKLSKLINVTEDNINEFYDLSKDTIKRSVEYALNSLADKSFITWRTIKMVCIINTNVPKNELGNVRAKEIYLGQNEYEEDVYRYEVNYRVQQIHREATEEEERIIIHTERDIMDQLNCKSKQEIIRLGLWEKFNNRVKAILFDKINILFSYDSYKILCNEDHILKIWNELQGLSLVEPQRSIKQFTLNTDIKNRLNDNAENRHNKSVNIKVKKDKDMRRGKREYIEDNHKLADTLIDITHKDIRKDIREVKLNKK